MKKLKRLFSLGVIYTLVLIMSFSLVACHNKDKNNTPPDVPPDVPVIEVKIGDAASTISAGETIQLTATVTGTDNTAVNWSVSDPATLMVSETGLVSVVTAPEKIDKNVIVTATSAADPTKKDTKPIRVKTAVVEGTVGRLTSAAIKAIGNDAITATGTVTDIYRNHYDSGKDRTTSYESEVKMEDGKWSGKWRVKNSNDEYIANVYKRGTNKTKYVVATDGYRAEYADGYEMLTEYIDKDNNIATKAVTDYLSVPTAWETQHLWNHLYQLNVNEFTYDPDTPEIYTMELDENADEDTLYLMAYIVVSLTPMLTGEDSLRSLTLVLDDDDKIVKLKGQSYISYSGAEYSQTGTLVDWSSMSYTEVELDFTGVGNTTVAGVTKYTADKNADKLTAALDEMHKATSYHYELTDTTTYQPEYDEGDYSVESLSNSLTMGAKNAAVNCGVTVKNRNDSEGTVGTRVWVTPAAILVEKTGKYSATSDGKAYHLEYSGYRQFDGYYEKFEYDSTITNEAKEKVGGLKGTKHVAGNLMSVMPKFEFSSALFSCVEGIQNGKQVYIFTLKETSVIRDIALQIDTMYYADSATAISGSASVLTLTVDADGHLISARYPYSLSGVYMGYCTVKYSGINATTISSDLATNYVERGWRTSWDQYTVMYYDDINGERINDMNAQAAIEDIYGANASGLPTAEDILNIFGDELSGPFYGDRQMEKPDGTKWLRRDLSLTLRSTEYDENGMVTNFDAIVAKCDEVFGAKGFVKDMQQTDVSGGESGRYSRYVVWTTDKITIVLENNFTKNFWLYFYNAGEYNRAA
ncbi:MAG: hypothetical protein J1G04_00715 [Clostridiales bacterium]|nr:hypothetical protein [Clostridiales bacterium]